MERKKVLNTEKEHNNSSYLHKINNKQFEYSWLGLIVFLLFMGIIFRNDSIFQATLPFVKLIIFGFIIYKSNQLLPLLIVPFGLLIEIIGVHTGFPFGSYFYTQQFGLQIFGVPLVIGLDWYIVVMGAYFITRSNLFTALLVLLFDLILEPVAIKMNWWVWPNGVPIMNYVSWMVLGYLFSKLISSEHIADKKNNLVAWIYYTNFIFILILLIL